MKFEAINVGNCQAESEETMEHKTSESVRKAIYNYDDKFERINCRFETGTKDRISKLGYTANNFIKLAVAEKLEREERILGKK